MTHPAAAGARGRSSAEAWPGPAERSRPERAAGQGGSGRRASRRIRPRARKPSLGAGTPGGRAAGGHGRRRRAGRRLVRTRGAAGRRGGPQAQLESGTRSPSVPRAGPRSRWRCRPGRRKGCSSGFYRCIPSSGPPRESAGAAGSPLGCPRPAAGPGAFRPHPLLGVFSFGLLAGAASPGAGAWHPAADRRSARPDPLPRTTKLGPPPPADVFTMVLTPPRWAPVGGSV